MFSGVHFTYFQCYTLNTCLLLVAWAMICIYGCFLPPCIAGCAFFRFFAFVRLVCWACFAFLTVRLGLCTPCDPKKRVLTPFKGFRREFARLIGLKRPQHENLPCILQDFFAAWCDRRSG